MRKFITYIVAIIAFFNSCFIYADIEIKTARDLSFFRLGYINSLMPFDAKEPSDSLQTIANLYTISYAIEGLPTVAESKYDTLPIKTQKAIAREYCEAYSTKKDAHRGALIILDNILLKY